MSDPQHPGALPRHVWIIDTSTNSPHAPEPGVLLEWRRGEKGWEGLVFHAWRGGAKMRWVLADELQPG